MTDELSYCANQDNVISEKLIDNLLFFHSSKHSVMLNADLPFKENPSIQFYAYIK